MGRKPRESASPQLWPSLPHPGSPAYLLPKLMQLREDLKEGGHRLTQVLLDHLLSNPQADEGNEADGLHTQDSPGLSPAWKPRNTAHELWNLSCRTHQINQDF